MNRENQPTPLEQQFILRFPEDVAEKLRSDLAGDLKDKLRMDLANGKVVYNNQEFEAKLLDLPCIVESYKSTDNKMLYKTADISQVLVCSAVTNEDGHANDKEKETEGLCRPFQNINKKRFKKIKRSKLEVNEKLKRLLEADAEAMDVKFDVVEAEEEPQQSTSNYMKNKSDCSWNFLEELLDQNYSENNDALSPESTSVDDIKTNLDNNDDEDVFGDVSSSEEEEGGNVNHIGGDDFDDWDNFD